jgi:death on curing protein
MIQFPSLEEALELQRLVIEKFGGASGIRDMGSLQSALYRPQTGYYEDVIQMAAALMESLLINHPFVDGNKRVAFFLTDIFLRMNGWAIDVKPTAGQKIILKLIEQSENRFEKLEAWLRKQVMSIN